VSRLCSSTEASTIYVDDLADLLGALSLTPAHLELRTGIDVMRFTPTLLVNGERGAPVLHRVTDKLEQLLPGVERVRIPDTSHLMYADDPDAFNRTALTFLQRHSAPSPNGT
jgi:hypothetical protein